MLVSTVTFGRAQSAPYADNASTRMDAWLPSYGSSFFPWLKKTATARDYARGADTFILHGRILSRFIGEIDGGGTFVGPVFDGEKGRVVYDPAHRIVFYAVGCCTLGERVLAFAPPPPSPIEARDLGDVHTERGIALGDSVATVRRIYGYAPLRQLRRRQWLSYAALYAPGHGCGGQWQDFVFRDGRLVFVELLDLC
ncbi:MAG TPA: hypothetical protein VME66_06315 [Candidatus Acidoferrales bacterium]|nr:hypothetical protein [Candidatus Acidoferrales bacterium]